LQLHSIYRGFMDLEMPSSTESLQWLIWLVDGKHLQIAHEVNSRKKKDEIAGCSSILGSNLWIDQAVVFSRYEKLF
jgi:hypothetical protein